MSKKKNNIKWNWGDTNRFPPTTEKVFHFIAPNGYDFYLGLSAVLNCLVTAIQNGALPKLPLSWLTEADYVCFTSFSEDANNYYSDNEEATR